MSTRRAQEIALALLAGLTAFVIGLGSTVAGAVASRANQDEHRRSAA